MRRHTQHVPLVLQGRYAVEHGASFPCSSQTVSIFGATIASEVLPRVGDHLMLVLEQLGRIEARTVRLTGNGFAVALMCTPAHRSMLASRIESARKIEGAESADSRRAVRVAPIQPHALVRHGNDEIAVTIIDLSLTGAAVSAQSLPPVGAQVFLGATQATVVRQFAGGFAIEFKIPFSPQVVTAAIKF